MELAAAHEREVERGHAEQQRDREQAERAREQRGAT
jgi:hypothetical protein